MPSEDTGTRTFDAHAVTRGPASAEEARFPPGTVLAGRYRIVALLGRGGMGEVYRAEDLKLGQTVALKFLPAAAADARALSRLLNEVRVAREVTHPHVCRVHDIVEDQGLHFLSMEYVDGEDLASLMRKIGRVPAEKAAELARQICAGLAAAHERGVLHRDLKPANVMVDGRGRARLTDFGLAVVAREGAAGGEVAGTPAYMAPEQLEGRGVSEKTDLYSLGLLLYELFTGRRPFTADSPADLKRRRAEAPTVPSTLVPGLDTGTESAILQCLEEDPARRPASAMAVAVALGGKDPLAAVLAAGETPAPEMVAAAGLVGALKPAAAAGLLAFVLAGLPLALALAERLTFLRQVPLELPPAVLAHRARDVARHLGLRPGPHEASGFAYDTALLERAGRGETPPGAPLIRYWHRTSPRPHVSMSLRRVTSQDPPLREPGMGLLWLDTEGRLLELASVPQEEDRAGPPLAWPDVLAAAGLDASSARPVDPILVPPGFADRRAAWELPHPRLGLPARVEAASHGGRLVFFQVTEAGRPAGQEGQLGRQARAAQAIFSVIGLVAMMAAAFLARRNLRLGRGDRAGAWRLAVFAFTARLAAWVLGTDHVADLVRQQSLLIAALGRALYSAGFLWVFYLAIEPAVRRRWPQALIAWSRLLAGRVRDPLVGRDTLLGLATALGMGFCWMGARLLPTWWGRAVTPTLADLDLLAGGTRGALAYLLLNAINAVGGCLLFVVTLLVFRMVLRSERVAAVAVLAIITGASALMAGTLGAMDVVGLSAAMALLLFAMVRLGFLAVTVVTFTLGAGRLAIPPTVHFGAWYGEPALAWLVFGYALAAWSFYVALGGRPFKLGPLED